MAYETRLGDEAVLSDGRVAFFSSDASDRERETIEVRDLLTGSTRTVVAFSGTVSPKSLALDGNRLTWAQQSTVVNVVSSKTAAGFTESCTPVPLSPVELTSLNLRHIPSSPVLVTGAPIPPQYANERPCIEGREESSPFQRKRASE